MEFYKNMDDLIKNMNEGNLEVREAASFLENIAKNWNSQKDMYEDRILDLENQVENIEYEKDSIEYDISELHSEIEKMFDDAVMFCNIWGKSSIEGAVLFNSDFCSREVIIEELSQCTPPSTPKEFVDLYTVFSSIFAAHMKVIF